MWDSTQIYTFDSNIKIGDHNVGHWVLGVGQRGCWVCFDGFSLIVMSFGNEFPLMGFGLLQWVLSLGLLIWVVVFDFAMCYFGLMVKFTEVGS